MEPCRPAIVPKADLQDVAGQFTACVPSRAQEIGAAQLGRLRCGSVQHTVGIRLAHTAKQPVQVRTTGSESHAATQQHEQIVWRANESACVRCAGRIAVTFHMPAIFIL